MKKYNHNKLIKYGQHTIADWIVIEIDGNKEKINEFLQGQLTSDINMINNNGFQLSSICDHKGFVICDFIIHVNADIYKVVINKELADIFIKDVKMKTWDLAPGDILLRELNSHIMDLYGKKIDYSSLEVKSGLVCCRDINLSKKIIGYINDKQF